MAIKSETFGRVELSEKDAARFLQHLKEDPPNMNAKASYKRGKAILRHVFGNNPKNTH
ncbi:MULTISPECIES: hypothetical protein [Pseudomonas]|uniref:hypothetical protein n=1 Tax=Pseudomonas TaxID=286 RepID=UPI001F35BD44|nr:MULTISPECIES: hypothetical protein [Pseudomonas]MCF6763035.1 hypothetical protein [Pseudomonas fragi]MCK6254975.1 hypothetical protein [Pseudomonas fragi]MDY7570152.1 hypothetical protein [Pseudomonas sp. CCC4.1]MEB0144848.1 hypothetical protein [Pseudomonas sp. CCC4.1]